MLRFHAPRPARRPPPPFPSPWRPETGAGNGPSPLLHDLVVEKRCGRCGPRVPPPGCDGTRGSTAAGRLRLGVRARRRISRGATLGWLEGGARVCKARIQRKSRARGPAWRGRCRRFSACVGRRGGKGRLSRHGSTEGKRLRRRDRRRQDSCGSGPGLALCLLGQPTAACLFRGAASRLNQPLSTQMQLFLPAAPLVPFFLPRCLSSFPCTIFASPSSGP